MKRLVSIVAVGVVLGLALSLVPARRAGYGQTVPVTVPPAALREDPIINEKRRCAAVFDASPTVFALGAPFVFLESADYELCRPYGKPFYERVYPLGLLANSLVATGLAWGGERIISKLWRKK